MASSDGEGFPWILIFIGGVALLLFFAGAGVFLFRGAPVPGPMPMTVPVQGSGPTLASTRAPSARPVVLDGTVTDAAGEPIPGARVEWTYGPAGPLDNRPEDPGGGWSWSRKQVEAATECDAQGLFRFPQGLHAGDRIRLRAMAPGYGTVTVDDVLLAGTSPYQQFTLEEECVLRGALAGAATPPPERFEVLVIRDAEDPDQAARNLRFARELELPAGSFEIRALAPGRYRFVARGRSQGSGRVELLHHLIDPPLIAGEVRDLGTLRAAGAEVAGRCVDRDGEGIAGVEVRAIQRGAAPPRSVRLVSGSDGSLALVGLSRAMTPEGVVTLRARIPDSTRYFPAHATARIGGTSVTLTLLDRELDAVHLRAVVPGGAALVEQEPRRVMYFRLIGPDGRSSRGGGGSKRYTREFTVARDPQARYRIEVTFLDLYGISDAIPVPEGGVTEVPVILSTGGTVRGQVIGSGGERLLITRVDGRELHGDREHRERACAVGIDGRVLIKGLPPTGEVEIVDERTGTVAWTVRDLGDGSRDLGTWQVPAAGDGAPSPREVRGRRQ